MEARRAKVGEKIFWKNHFKCYFCTTKAGRNSGGEIPENTDSGRSAAW